MVGNNDFTPFISLGPGAGGAPAWEQFDIGGIRLRAFYDASHKLLFVLDITQDGILPNVLLVVRRDGERKWDEMLATDFNVDPESVRPRVKNKYQKLDIDYDSLNYYNDAILSGRADVLSPVRKEIAERQKEFRQGEAHHEIELAEATVREAKKTIADLDEFIKLQHEKLKAQKKNMGKEPPKYTAAKILRYESRIEKALEKKKRSARRLKRAESRIDSANKMLHNYKTILLPESVPEAPKPAAKSEAAQRTYVSAMPWRENMNEDDVKPLFTENPNIMDADNAFKPVSFGGSRDEPVPQPQPRPMPAPMPVPPSVGEFSAPRPEPHIVERPRSIMAEAPGAYIAPSAPMERPVAPVSGMDVKIETPDRSRPGGAYYLMLMLLIGLSIFTLYLYQKKMNPNAMPHIAATKSDVAEPAQTEPVQETTPAAVDATIPTEGTLAAEPAVQEPVPAPAAPEPIPEAIPEVLPEPGPGPLPEAAAEPEFIEAAPLPVDIEEPVMEYEDTGIAEPDIPEGEVEILEYQENEGTFENEPFAPGIEE